MIGFVFACSVVSLCSAFTARGPIANTPGVSVRCNRTEACLPFSQREQFSLDFLCCEDKNGWVSPHFLLPFGTYLFTHSVALTMLQVLFFEYIEATGLLLGANSIFAVDDNTPLETWAGSLAGDGTIGFLGIAVAALFVWATRAPPLLRSEWTGSFWCKYFLLWSLYGALFVLHLWRLGDDNPLNPGAIVTTAAQLLYLLALMPWYTTRTRKDRILVWQNPRTTKRRYKKSHVWTVFGLWAFVVFSTQIQTVGFQYLPNDWYQVLVSVLLVVLVLALVGAARAH